MEPVVKEVLVPVSPDLAFRRFTEEMGAWWPLATHSVHRDEATGLRCECRIGGRLVETATGGREAEWGEVTVWEPPRRVAFTWHPGGTPAMALRVDVTFSAEAEGTRLRLVQDGWEILGTEAERRHADYERGWIPVLEQYAGSLRVEA